LRFSVTFLMPRYFPLRGGNLWVAYDADTRPAKIRGFMRFLNLAKHLDVTLTLPNTSIAIAVDAQDQPRLGPERLQSRPHLRNLCYPLQVAENPAYAYISTAQRSCEGDQGRGHRHKTPPTSRASATTSGTLGWCTISATSSRIWGACDKVRKAESRADGGKRNRLERAWVHAMRGLDNCSSR